MNLGSIAYVNLEELSNTDYKIIDGQADITGWPVVDESSSTIGKVRDLLFDPAQNAIRYIIVDLDDSITDVEDKAILFPIGYINMAEGEKKVVIPVMDRQRYAAMPRYIIGEVTRNTEMEIRNAIGSPAALRIEEEIREDDHSEFYQHHHFDRGNITSKRAVIHADKDQPQATSTGREEESNTIHQLVDNSHFPNAAAAESQETLNVNEKFNINIDHKALTIEPLENGTYRIFDQEEKIGLIYPEVGENEVKWGTMDPLDQQTVNRIGDAITERNAIH